MRSATVLEIYCGLLSLLLIVAPAGASYPLDLKLYTRGGTSFAPGDTIDLFLGGINSSNQNVTLTTASYRVTYNLLFFEYEVFRTERQVEPEATIPPGSPVNWSWRIGGNLTWKAPPGEYRFSVTIRDPQGNIVGAPQHSISISYWPVLARFFSNLWSSSQAASLQAAWPTIFVLLALSSGVVGVRRGKSVLEGARISSLATSLLVGFSVALALLTAGLGWAAAITLVLFVEYWALMNGKVRGYYSRILLGRLLDSPIARAFSNKLETNPAAIFIGACYLLLIAVTATLLTASLRLVDTSKALEAANLVASYIFLLIVLVVVTQALWNIYLRKRAQTRRSSRR